MQNSMKTVSYNINISLNQSDLKLPNGNSTIRGLKKMINKGNSVGILKPYNNLNPEFMTKTKGIYFKYANQKYRQFKFKVINKDIYVYLQRYDNDNYQCFGKVNNKNKDIVKMALKNCSSYSGEALITGGSKRVTTVNNSILYQSGEYGIDLEITFYFKKDLEAFGFYLPKPVNYKEIEDIKNYVVFDLELISGANLFTEIIEIGAIKYIDGEEFERFQTYIKPKQHIPYITKQITSIDDEKVKDSEPIETILPKFLEFIGSLPLIGHDIGNNDVRIIKKEMCNLNIGFLSNQILDTLTMAREIYDFENYKLETIKNKFNLNINSHEAINDCIVSNQIFVSYKKKIKREIK